MPESMLGSFKAKLENFEQLLSKTSNLTVMHGCQHAMQFIIIKTNVFITLPERTWKCLQSLVVMVF